MKDTLSGSILGSLEGLKVTHGRMAGEPFPVFPWERRFVRGSFQDHVIEGLGKRDGWHCSAF